MRPIVATIMTEPPETGSGFIMRFPASITIQTITPDITMPFTNAASASSRPWPNE